MTCLITVTKGEREMNDNEATTSYEIYMHASYTLSNILFVQSKKLLYLQIYRLTYYKSPN